MTDPESIPTADPDCRSSRPGATRTGRRAGRAAILAAAAFAFVTAVLPAPLRAANLIVNGDFDEGLAGWEVEGGVAPLAGFAVLSDESAARSVLHQVIATNAGTHTVSFEFRNLTGSFVPEGGFPDTVFATVYLVADAGAFDPAAGSGFVASVPLFDLDAEGAFNVVDDGEFATSTADPAFTRFAARFENPLGLMVAIVFDLIDLNLTSQDSTFVVDRVRLESTPTPPFLHLEPAGDFIRLLFNLAVETSDDLAPDGWQRLDGILSPLHVLVTPSGRDEPQFRAVASPGFPVPELAESDAAGLRRIDFVGRLQYSFEADPGEDGWIDVPEGTLSPVLSAPATMKRRFFRGATLAE